MPLTTMKPGESLMIDEKTPAIEMRLVKVDRRKGVATFILKGQARHLDANGHLKRKLTLDKK